MVKKVEMITSEFFNIYDEFSLNRLVGKNVLSKEGEIVGKVQDIVVRNFSLIGIVVKKLFKSPVFIDKMYINTFNQNGIILKIIPVTSLVGLKVFDKNGRDLGKVKKMVRHNTKNEFASIVVKSGLFKTKEFQSKDIEKISENIILSIEVKEEKKK